MRTTDNLLIVPPGEGRSYGHIERLIEARETGGRWGVVIVRSDRGSSGWTHLHRGEPEAFFILEGDLELCGAETVTRVGPGTFVLVPPDVEHSFRVLSVEARWLAIWPSTLDGLLEELEQARTEGRDDLQTVAAIRARHGTQPGRRIGE
jgi:quercetin dioxygenase-like cupin family protein